MNADAAKILGQARWLIETYGHNAAELVGSPHTGYSVPGAIEQAAGLAYAAGQGYPTLGRWITVHAALRYLAAVLGYDPRRQAPGQLRDLATFAADGAASAPMGTAWAAAVLDQAAELADPYQARYGNRVPALV